jgi:hypothetical protein
LSSNWGINGAIVENAGIAGVVDDIERNVIHTAYAGFQLRGTSGPTWRVAVMAQGNQFAHLYYAWEVWTAGNPITAHRNGGGRRAGRLVPPRR